jgi:hypothetical protein
MPDFGIEVDGDRLVALRFEQFPERARAALAKRLSGITQQLLARVQSSEPSRTGRLRAETQAFVDSRENAVKGSVKVVTGAAGGRAGSEHGKAAALEYGAHGSAKVGAHRAGLSHVFGHPITPREVSVATYTRRVNIAERRYLRSPLDGMRSQIIEELRQALAEAAAE